ncbi:MAG: hypothetical protein ACK5P6_02025, partial [Pseudobdellovibrionaceae bacterium]
THRILGEPPKHEIIGYFENGYTNGFTERMNGTGKLVFLGIFELTNSCVRRTGEPEKEIW